MTAGKAEGGTMAYSLDGKEYSEAIPAGTDVGTYTVWYRVHSQDYGWLGSAHNGAEAGTTGLAKRAEAIDVQILPQGQVPAGYDAGKAACVTA